MLYTSCAGRSYQPRCATFEKSAQDRQAEALVWKQRGFPSMIGYVPTCPTRKVPRGFALLTPLCLTEPDDYFDL